MSNIFDQARNIIKNLSNNAVSSWQQASQQPFVGGLAGKVLSNPAVQRWNPVSQVQSAFSMRQAPPQQAQYYRQQVQQATPQLNIAKNIQNPYLRFAGQVGEGLVNVLPNAVAGGLKLPAARNFQQGASDIASIAELPLSLTGFGVGKQVATQLGKQGIKFAIKQGAKTGAAYGGLFGGLEGLREGEYDSVLKQLGKAALGTGTGAVFGGVLGGVLGGGGALLKKYIFKSPQVEAQLRDSEGRWTAGEKPVKPKGMAQPAWDFQLKFNAKHERNPYTPVYVSDLSRELPAGLSIKYTKNPRQPLAQEARKYKSAEEFIINKLPFKLDIENAKGGKIKAYLDLNGKRLETGVYPNDIPQAELNRELAKFGERFYKEGKIQNIGTQSLTDFYNQATGGLEGGGVKEGITKNIVKPVEQIQQEVQQVVGSTPKIPVTNLSKPQTPVLGGSGISGGGSGKSLQNQSSKYSYNINKNRLQLNVRDE